MLTVPDVYADTAMLVVTRDLFAPEIVEARERFDEHARVLIEPVGPFNRLDVVDGAGRVVASTEPGVTMSLIPEGVWFQTGQDVSETVAVEGTLTDPFDHAQGIYFSLPVRDAAGNATGVILLFSFKE